MQSVLEFGNIEIKW